MRSLGPWGHRMTEARERYATGAPCSAIDLKRDLAAALIANSGLEQHRRYIGMSGIGRCPCLLYRQYLDGRGDLTDQHHWNCWLGYLFEGGVVALLDGIFGIERRPLEIVAPFDDRFRGHIDYQTPAGDLVEIKSTSWRGFKSVIAHGGKRAHRAQVQMYLRHGGFERGLLVYVARDVPWDEWNGLPLWVVEERPDDRWADSLDRKARLILAHVDQGDGPPACTCGRCE